MSGLFPAKIDHHYTGFKFAKWFFYLITILTLSRSVIHMILSDGGAESIATIPLNTFTENGAASVVLLMGLWGASQLMVGLVYLVVIWRYAAFIPFMYLLLFLEYSLRMLLMHIKPIHISGTAPGNVADYIMIPLSLLLLYFSLYRPRERMLFK